MMYRRRMYTIAPEKLAIFNEFFHTYLLPNQLKHGARLIGRWATADKAEVVAIWQYQSLEDYRRIEAVVQQDELHQLAKQHKGVLEGVILTKQEDFLTATGEYDV